MFKDVLVHIDEAAIGAKRLAFALAFTAPWESQIFGVHVETPVDVSPAVGALAAERIAGALAKRERDNARTAQEMFYEALTPTKRAHRWTTARGDMADVVCREARYADLVIVGQDVYQGAPERHPLPIAHSVALHAGRPVLMTPRYVDCETPIKRVVIAWDATREAARAVHDALPLLQHAAEVHAVIINPEDEGRTLDSQDLRRLSAHLEVLFTVRVPWGEVAVRSLWPTFKLDASAAMVITGVFGTTISPYLFFWQASEEVEDMQARHGRALTADQLAAKGELRRIKWDTWSGMFYSDISAYFIILACGVTLHVAGVADINTAAQAAKALRPLAGDFAYILFALGILGVGLIGVPVLAGSAAYGLSEALGWKEGLELKATDARGFYGVIAVSVLLALILQYTPIDPMKALFYSAVINGVVAVPLLVVIILLATKKSVMGAYTASRTLQILGWITVAVMGVAAVLMLLPS